MNYMVFIDCLKVVLNLVMLKIILVDQSTHGGVKSTGRKIYSICPFEHRQLIFITRKNFHFLYKWTLCCNKNLSNFVCCE